MFGPAYSSNISMSMNGNGCEVNARRRENIILLVITTFFVKSAILTIQYHARVQCCINCSETRIQEIAAG